MPMLHQDEPDGDAVWKHPLHALRRNLQQPAHELLEKAQMVCLRELRVLFFIGLISGLSDVTTTLVAIHHFGGEEFNPLVAQFVNFPAIMVILKIIVILAIIALFSTYQPLRKFYEKQKVAVSICVFYFWIVASLSNTMFILNQVTVLS